MVFGRSNVKVVNPCQGREDLERSLEGFSTGNYLREVNAGASSRGGFPWR